MVCMRGTISPSRVFVYGDTGASWHGFLSARVPGRMCCIDIDRLADPGQTVGGVTHQISKGS